jgi:hypothetical protein
MSQKANLKNQNKLKVYLSKVKNDIKQCGSTNNGNRGTTPSN